jgi:hypothetical protein
MNYIGIDPGLGTSPGGCIAVIGQDRTVKTMFRLSKKEEPEIRSMLASWLFDPHFVVLEKVWGLPGCQGQFPFGDHFGFLKGVLTAWDADYILAAPQTWMRGVKMAGLQREKSERKGDLKTEAKLLFPDVKVTLAESDALLIAEYAWRLKNEPVPYKRETRR